MTGILFAISGLRGTGRTSAFLRLKRILPETLRDKRFAFIDNPFEGQLQHPLLWSPAEKQEHATTRLLGQWKPMNQTTVSRIVPALQKVDIVVVDGFGLDALLYATGCVYCDKENAEGAELHHELVKIRVKTKQGITPPTYLITKANAGVVDSKMVTAFPYLEEIAIEDRMAYIRHQEDVMRDYFKPEHGQKQPHYFDVSNSIETVCAQMVRAIRSHMEA